MIPPAAARDYILAAVPPSGAAQEARRYPASTLGDIQAARLSLAVTMTRDRHGDSDRPGLGTPPAGRPHTSCDDLALPGRRRQFRAGPSRGDSGSARGPEAPTRSQAAAAAATANRSNLKRHGDSRGLSRRPPSQLPVKLRLAVTSLRPSGRRATVSVGARAGAGPRRQVRGFPARAAAPGPPAGSAESDSESDTVTAVSSASEQPGPRRRPPAQPVPVPRPRTRRRLGTVGGRGSDSELARRRGRADSESVRGTAWASHGESLRRRP